MTETTKTDDADEKQELSRPKKLELKKTVETGQVRQSFSHGRSKMVQVEVRKKRTFARDAGGTMSEVKSNKAQDAVFSTPGTASDDATALSNLTEHEIAVRARALEEATTATHLAAAAEAAAAEEAARRAAEAPEPEAESEATAEAAVEPVAEEPVPASIIDPSIVQAAQPDPDGIEEAKRSAPVKKTPKIDPAKKAPTRRGEEQRRRSGKLTIEQALGDGEERMRSLASLRRARERQKAAMRQGPIETTKIVREVVIPETITVQELANRMAERSSAVIKVLMNIGVMATITQSIDADTAELVVSEFGHTMRRVSESDVEEGLRGSDDAAGSLRPRPPVVTVMGHVDHGKTSLLDALRETDVVAREAGGITQHIGAYQVTMAGGEQITFIDTPGHAAFTEMRSRGAKVTDIVVLCVAADDGVMPQTIEAINHAKAAGVPIIVAINKIDTPGADPARVKTELLQHEIIVEDMSGETLAIEVSAKERTNLDKLEEAILLQAELLDLKANPDRAAEGVVVEARMEQGRGSVSTILIQRGTLRIGDIFVAGAEWGRVRALADDRGNKIESAGPGLPAEVLGLNGSPFAGDEVSVVETESRAREITEYRQRRHKDTQAAKIARGTLEQMFEKIQQGEKETLPVVIKGDVHGSVEAIEGAIEKLNTDEVSVQILHGAVGGINESDVTLANASNALILGFNVRANPQARAMARRDGVEIRYYSIIYDAIDDLRKALSGMLSPEIRETFIGNAEIREVFNITKAGKIAGCMVTEGMVKRGAKVRLLRDDVVVHEGELSQLKRFKDDVKEVKDGTECGMAFANYQDIQVGDIIECFEVEEIAREL